MCMNLTYPFLYSYICWNLGSCQVNLDSVTLNKFAGTQQCFLVCVLAEVSAGFIFH